MPQEINKRASEKPRLMTGPTWQPAATCGEADCSEESGPDASVSLDGDTNEFNSASEGLVLDTEEEDADKDAEEEDTSQEDAAT